MTLSEKFIAGRSIRTLVVYIILAALLPSLGIVLVLEWNLFTAKDSEIRARGAELAHISAVKHADTINQARMLLDSAALTLRDGRLSPEDTKAYLKHLIRENPQFSSFNLVGVDGLLQLTTASEDHAINLADRMHFQIALQQNRFAVGQAIVSRTANLPVLPFALPVQNRSGEVASILHLGLKLDSYQEYYASLNVPDGTRFLLVDRKGIRLFRYPIREISPIGEKISSDVWNCIKDRWGQTMTFDSIDPTGEPVSYAFRPLKGVGEHEADLGILVGIPVTDAFAALAPVAMQTLLAFTLISCIVFTVAVTLSEKFYSRGLVVLDRQLTARTTSTMLDRIDAPVASREIVALAASFNRLLDMLKDDRTAKSKVEQALRDSEENFRSFFETMTDLIWVGTPQGQIMFTNSAVTRTLGYTPEELQTMHLLDVHPVDRRQEAEDIFAAMFRGERDSCPLPLLAKDGRLVPVETRAWFGMWNGVHCVFGISKNLTVEQEAHQRFERLFHSNPAAMALSQWPERRLLDVNNAFLAVTGYSREEVLGNTVQNLGLFVDDTQFERAAMELSTSTRVNHCELLVRRKDGSVRDGVFSGEVIVSQGKTYFLTVMLDITERKIAERRLQESEERLELALKATKAGLWDWNVLTGIVVIDERWAGMLGYHRDELVPMRNSDRNQLCHPDDLVKSEARMQRHFSGDLDYYSCDLRMRHKDGHWVWVRDRGQCVERGPDGLPLRVVGTHVDVTAPHQDRELRDDIERIVRHDLRSPACSAVNVARILADSPTLGEADRELARLLEISGREMLDMLNFSLDLYKIERGQYIFMPEMVKIEDAIEQALLPLRDNMRQMAKNVRFERADSAQPIVVRGSEFLLRMALRNLLQNALEATPPNGFVTVRVAEKEGCRLEIINPGVVPATIRERFFEKYVTAAKKGGTGLGTYSAKLMIEAQGGSIRMETSDKTNETVVEITIPT